jgi:hypothetical protein
MPAPDALFSWLATAEGSARVWGVYSRLLGLVLLVAHAPLARDLRESDDDDEMVE